MNRIIGTPAFPYLYLCISLSAVVLLALIIPPMQTLDENRHFLRIIQFANGHLLSEIDNGTHLAGGTLPNSVFRFVQLTVNTNFLQQQTFRKSIGARMQALDLASQSDPPMWEKRFGAFPTPSVYSPALYVPQILAVAVTQSITNKAYVWFYAARILNSCCALLLVFAAFRVAPEHRLLLLFPVSLPMTPVQFASVSTDAGIIALSVLFTALCIRFRSSDGFWIRFSLTLCLTLLTAAKPVYLGFALLLLTSYPRLNLRRVASFFVFSSGIATAVYAAWSYLVRGFYPLVGEANGQNPSQQLNFIMAHPLLMVRVLAVTIYHDGFRIFREMVGTFGWAELPVGLWYVLLSFVVLTVLLIVLAYNLPKVQLSAAAIGIGTMAAIVFGLFVAGYVLWNYPAAPMISRMQGRYFIPSLAILASLSPRFKQLSKWSGILLFSVCVGYFLLSSYETVRIASRFFFPSSRLLGTNISTALKINVDAACPAIVQTNGNYETWFSFRETGSVAGNDPYKILFATEDGIILSETDSADNQPHTFGDLARNRRKLPWSIQIWRPNQSITGHLWLARGSSACAFGPRFFFQPFRLQDTESVRIDTVPKIHTD